MDSATPLPHAATTRPLAPSSDSAPCGDSALRPRTAGSLPVMESLFRPLPQPRPSPHAIVERLFEEAGPPGVLAASSSSPEDDDANESGRSDGASYDSDELGLPPSPSPSETHHFLKPSAAPPSSAALLLNSLARHGLRLRHVQRHRSLFRAVADLTDTSEHSYSRIMAQSRELAIAHWPHFSRHVADSMPLSHASATTTANGSLDDFVHACLDQTHHRHHQHTTTDKPTAAPPSTITSSSSQQKENQTTHQDEQTPWIPTLLLVLATLLMRPICIYHAGHESKWPETITPITHIHNNRNEHGSTPQMTPIHLCRVGSDRFFPLYIITQPSQSDGVTINVTHPNANTHTHQTIQHDSHPQPTHRKSVRIAQADNHDTRHAINTETVSTSLSQQISDTFLRGQLQLYRDMNHTPDIQLIECGSASVDDLYMEKSKRGYTHYTACHDDEGVRLRWGDTAGCHSREAAVSFDVGVSSVSASCASSLRDALSRQASAGSLELNSRFERDGLNDAATSSPVSSKRAYTYGALNGNNSSSNHVGNSSSYGNGGGSSSGGGRDHIGFVDATTYSKLAQRLMSRGHFSPGLGRSQEHLHQQINNDDTDTFTQIPPSSSSASAAVATSSNTQTRAQQQSRVTSIRDPRVHDDSRQHTHAHQLHIQHEYGSANSSVDSDEYQQIQAAIQLSLEEQHQHGQQHHPQPTLRDDEMRAGVHARARAVSFDTEVNGVYDEDDALMMAIAMSLETVDTNKCDVGDANQPNLSVSNTSKDKGKGKGKARAE